MFMDLLNGLAWMLVIGAILAMTGLVIVGIAGLFVKMGEAIKGSPTSANPPTEEELARQWQWK